MAGKLALLTLLAAPAAVLAQDVPVSLPAILSTTIVTGSAPPELSLTDVIISTVTSASGSMTLPVESLSSVSAITETPDPRPTASGITDSASGSMTLPVEGLPSTDSAGSTLETSAASSDGATASESGASASESSSTGAAPKATGMVAAGVLGAVGAIGMAVL